MINTILFNLARRLKTARVLYQPQSLQLEVTNACNLGCIECYRHTQKFKPGFITIDNFKKIIEQFPYLQAISLFGTGESLLHKDFFKMVEYLRKVRKKIKIFLTSNGTLLNDENIKKIVDYHIHLAISLDAVNEETYKKVAGRTAVPYDRIPANIGNFLKNYPDYNFGLTYMVLNENFNESPEFVKLSAKLGIKKIVLGEQQFYEERPQFNIKDKDLYKQRLKEATELGKKLGVSVRHTKRDRLIWGDETKIEPCSFLWKQPFITWDGWWVLCCARPFPLQFTFGNILEVEFKKLWFGEQANTVRKGILNSDLSLAPVCKGCQHLKNDNRHFKKENISDSTI